MSDASRNRSIWFFEYGEAYDDLRSAFYIDEARYSSPEHARSVVEAASAALRRMGIIFEVELRTTSAEATSTPTWEEFKQRHFVDGVPIPVQPRRKRTVVPPSWDAMNSELGRANNELRDDLVRALTLAFPDSRVFVTADRGPVRRSAASVDWSQEQFGFEVAVGAAVGELRTDEALAVIAEELVRSGWTLGAVEGDPDQATSEGHRGQFRVWVQATPGNVEVCGYSPLYRAPAEANTTWVSEPRTDSPQ